MLWTDLHTLTHRRATDAKKAILPSCTAAAPQNRASDVTLRWRCARRLRRRAFPSLMMLGTKGTTPLTLSMRWESHVSIKVFVARRVVENIDLSRSDSESVLRTSFSRDPRRRSRTASETSMALANADPSSTERLTQRRGRS